VSNLVCRLHSDRVQVHPVRMADHVSLAARQMAFCQLCVSVLTDNNNNNNNNYYYYYYYYHYYYYYYF